MVKKALSTKTISEPAREISVFSEAEVVVVGGGPAGVSAAIAAAREGADTLLVERYGYLGGMATGGLVLMINQYPPGQCQEWLDKLDKVDGANDLSKTKEPGMMRHAIMVDPELLKCILNDMALEAGVRQLLHSWGTRAIVEKNNVKGIVFESKSGRQAVLGKVIIDATGDGDVFASAGAEFDAAVDEGYRSSALAMVFRIGGIDFDKFVEFRQSRPEKWQAMREEVNGIAGFHVGPVPAQRKDVVWVNSFIKDKSAIKVEDLTWVEINVRKAMIPVYEYFKKRLPGFEKSYIYDSASQTGTRGSRRLVGEYVLTKKDIKARKSFNDVVGVFPQAVPTGMAPENMQAKNVGLPYRCLVPATLDGLLAAGRCFSSDQAANTMFNIIPHCVVMGQAAGTAAALAVKNKVKPRNVDYKALKARLIAQGMALS
jgi:ribulose 1,5-bisphosphate synthetase/thiazole synthase